ncbi:unnamed protein product [Eruca vesicaria subsp. sativa]|uniref:Uncharacterized protein n=1 Tax=Eruca vesicaria subsp. sativa TaxID=29727 RepID=A0ABC8JQR3_ERUVS|nr:unnamed protein product [Eruca vesicaria subsp. sativa]
MNLVSTKAHRRLESTFRLFKERYEGVKAKHAEQVEVEKLNAKIEVIVHVEKVFGQIKEKERLEEKLILAKEMMAQVKVPLYPDWCKLGEAWLYD